MEEIRLSLSDGKDGPLFLPENNGISQRLASHRLDRLFALNENDFLIILNREGDESVSYFISKSSHLRVS